MASDKETRTEQATPRQREKYRDEGKVPLSQEIIAVSVLVVGGVALYLVVGGGGHELQLLCGTMLGGLDRALESRATEWAEPALHAAAGLLLPVALASTAGAVASGMAQTRGLFSFKSLSLDLGRLNPLPKLKQMLFSKTALLSLLQSTGKVAVIVALTWQVFVQELQAMLEIGDRPPLEILGHFWGALLRLSIQVVGLLVAFAALDYVLVRRRLEQEMRMSRHEVREEHREHEGDPEVKRRQRMKANEMLKRRMVEQVKRADVVLVNPTHYAVALRYDASTMPAPAVVAKGQDEVAARIREVARSHRVPILHNPPLARALFAEVRAGRLIPPRLFGAVAEVLAYVYRLRGRAA